MPTEQSEQHKLSSSYVKILMEDVITSKFRLEGEDTQNHRRDFIRTCFASIEGLVWNYREQVLSTARTMMDLEPAEEAALHDISYQVTAQGKITEQPRYLPLPTSIKLLARIASKIETKGLIDFSNHGWQDLKDTITVRNRLTHPKSENDLMVSDKDISQCTNGYIWLLDTVLSSMERNNSSLRSYLSDFELIVQKLKDGDPRMTAIYQFYKSRELD